jgi:hypothetical protein
MEHSDGIGATTHTGKYGIGQGAVALETLDSRFSADDGLQFAHEIGIRMWSYRGA